MPRIQLNPPSRSQILQRLAPRQFRRCDFALAAEMDRASHGTSGRRLSSFEAEQNNQREPHLSPTIPWQAVPLLGAGHLHEGVHTGTGPFDGYEVRMLTEHTGFSYNNPAPACPLALLLKTQSPSGALCA